MVKISIQAAHEQVNPRDLLNDVVGMDDEQGTESLYSTCTYAAKKCVILEHPSGRDLQKVNREEFKKS
jgi:hypothetical protein